MARVDGGKARMWHCSNGRHVIRFAPVAMMGRVETALIRVKHASTPTLRLNPRC
jgi:hypothetical protein